MKEKIMSIIQSRCALEEEICEESRFKELSLDSLSFVAALVDMEETFGIEFELEELDCGEWETVGDIIKAAEEKINDKK